MRRFGDRGITNEVVVSLDQYRNQNNSSFGTIMGVIQTPAIKQSSESPSLYGSAQKPLKFASTRFHIHIVRSFTALPGWNEIDFQT